MRRDSSPGSPVSIHIVLGTRAQLIKMAPVMLVLEAANRPFNLVLTDQHVETMETLLREFGVRTQPRRLWPRGREVSGLVQMGIWLTRSLVRLLWRSDRWFGEIKAQRAVMLVHGDTFSTLLGALAGRVLGVTVAHVESGLRSHRWFHPFPEEITRLAVFSLAQVAYCPGEWAIRNLEGRRLRVVNMGANTLLDAVRLALARPVDAKPARPYFVVSIHRFENVFRRNTLARIVSIVVDRARRNHGIFVMHPVTESKLRASGLYEVLSTAPGVELVPRMGYLKFINLIAGAEYVITDGGSNQEELSYLGVPTVLMRAATERQEGLGSNVLISNYDAGLIDNFLAAAPRRDQQIPMDLSPSRAIAEDLTRAFA